jgi:hypothetical protein
MYLRMQRRWVKEKNRKAEELTMSGFYEFLIQKTSLEEGSSCSLEDYGL